VWGGGCGAGGGGGGGVGGLAAAVALQREGIPVTVFERDASVEARAQGYGMTIASGNTALGALGLLDELVARDTTSSSHWIFRDDGRIIGYFGRAFSGAAGEAFSGAAAGTSEGAVRGNLRVPRLVLRQMLLARLEGDAVRWNAKVVGVREREGEGCGRGVELDVEDVRDGTRRTHAFACLVVADGLRSSLRRFHPTVRRRRRSGCDDDPLTFLGVFVCVGLSALRHPLVRGRGFYTYGGDGGRLFVMPYSVDADGEPDKTMWQLSFPCATEAEALAWAKGHATPAEVLGEVRRRVARWHAPVPALVQATALDDLWFSPLYDRPVLVAPAKGSTSRITVVGDSAHPMSMFKGMGANTALHDGPHLAKVLAKALRAQARKQAENPGAAARSGGGGGKGDAVGVAVAVWERQMVQRHAKTVMASRAAAEALHDAELQRGASHRFAGCATDADGAKLLDALADRGVGAHSVEAHDVHLAAFEARVRDVGQQAGAFPVAAP